MCIASYDGVTAVMKYVVGGVVFCVLELWPLVRDAVLLCTIRRVAVCFACKKSHAVLCTCSHCRASPAWPHVVLVLSGRTVMWRPQLACWFGV